MTIEKPTPTSNTTTVLYSTETCTLLCSLQLTQRMGNDPSIVIECPQNAVNSSFFGIVSDSTKHHIIVKSIYGGTLVDFVNCISFCLIKARVNCNIPVGAMDDDGNILISIPEPKCNRVVYFSGTDRTFFDSLLLKCHQKYGSILRLAFPDESATNLDYY